MRRPRIEFEPPAWKAGAMAIRLTAPLLDGLGNQMTKSPISGGVGYPFEHCRAFRSSYVYTSSSQNLAKKSTRFENVKDWI